jgi:hypothetical protein
LRSQLTPWAGRTGRSASGGRGQAAGTGEQSAEATVTETTVMLVAHDGEWTRRRVADPSAARQLANRLAIPLYDVRLVGYPQRMREYNQRRRAAGT